MEIEAREVLFIRQNAPRWLFGQVAKNTGEKLSKVKYHFYGLPNSYDDKIIEEARRLLKVSCNIVYSNQ